jgi:ankyrin repeat protein
VKVKKLLAEGADVNEQDDSKWTALQWAARGAGKGQNSERATEVMQLLKEAGADLLSENATGNTALHHAAHWGDAKATALLISWYTKEQVDQKTKLGWSALHWAGKAGAVCSPFGAPMQCCRFLTASPASESSLNHAGGGC